jgi:hypothetical protein
MIANGDGIDPFRRLIFLRSIALAPSLLVVRTLCARNVDPFLDVEFGGREDLVLAHRGTA